MLDRRAWPAVAAAPREGGSAQDDQRCSSCRRGAKARYQLGWMGGWRGAAGGRRDLWRGRRGGPAQVLVRRTRQKLLDGQQVHAPYRATRRKGGRSEDAPRVTKDVPRHKARNVGGASAQSASESVTGWTPSSIAGGVGGRGASGGHVKHAIRPGCVMASGEARGWVAPPQTWLAKRGGVSRRGPHRQPGPTVEALAPPPPSWWSKLSFVVGCPPHRLSPTTTFFGGKRSAVSAARDPWTRSRGGRLKFHRLGCTRVHACAPIASEASSTMLRGRQTA